MCLAMYINKGFVFLDQLQAAHQANSDGCGFMWIENKKINIIKGYFDYNQFSELFLSIFGIQWISPVVIHFRTASSSGTYFDTCHPFMVNKDLAFVHNGSFFEMEKYFGKGFTDDFSDTMRFNERILKRLPKNFLDIPEIKDCLKRYCKENFSKMIFMDSQGKVTIINEEAGYWKDDVWYSNGGIENYTGYGFSGAYYYNRGDIRHKGGLISPFMFGNERAKKWQQCPICLGYYREERFQGDHCSGCKTIKELFDYAR